MIFFADNSKRLMSIEEIGLSGGGFWDGSIGGRRIDLPIILPNGGGAPVAITNTAQVSSSPLGFDFDLSKIGQVPRRLASQADVRSAYEVFTTGTSRGRGLGYAQDVLRRFTPGLIQTYGAANIRIAAANYLDSVGLPRLAQIVSPEPLPGPTPIELPEGPFYPLPVAPDPVQTPTPEVKSPVELLIDALPRLFGQAVYSPPLQSQATGYTPVSGDFGGGLGATAGGGSGVGVWLLLGGAAIAAYFIYKRYVSG